MIIAKRSPPLVYHMTFHYFTEKLSLLSSDDFFKEFFDIMKILDLLKKKSTSRDAWMVTNKTAGFDKEYVTC